MTSVAMDRGGRPTQEDNAVAFSAPDGSIAFGVVADGLGGHGDGELASSIVVKTAERFWKALPGRDDNGNGLLRDIIDSANDQIVSLQQTRDTGARTTICCALARGNEVDIASVGDSRGYWYSHSEVTRLTRDHSVTEMLLATGAISEEGMRTHPDSSRLTQSLGTDEGLKPFTVRRQVLRAGEAILLCSDGLWQSLSNLEIADRLASDTSGGRVASLVRHAAEVAGAAGDNVSAVLLEPFSESRPGVLGGLGRMLSRLRS